MGDDGSQDAKRAGDLAAGMTRLFGAEVVLMRAYEKPPEPRRGWSAQDRRELDEALFREELALEVREEESEAIAGSRPESKLIDPGPTLAMLLGHSRAGRRPPSSPWDGEVEDG